MDTRPILSEFPCSQMAWQHLFIVSNLWLDPDVNSTGTAAMMLPCRNAMTDERLTETGVDPSIPIQTSAIFCQRERSVNFTSVVKYNEAVHIAM